MNTLTATEAPTTAWTEIRRDGKYFAAVPTANLLAWFHAHHSYSMDHALAHEGYSLHAVEERYAVYYSTYDAMPPVFHRAFDTMRGANRSAQIMFTKLARARRIGDVHSRIETTAQLERFIAGRWTEV